MRQLTGDYVARIFAGARPADLPIQQPDRFTLAVNLRVARQLNLRLPTTFLARADEVID
ncbi:MAG: ABC transporter substrate binding protein [Beijerinckiaceae bacterium]